VSCIIIVDCNITEDSPRVLCPSRPYSRLGSLSRALDYPSGQPPNRSPSPAIPNPPKNSSLQMSLPLDTPQGVADALGYLQHHLQELTERQHASENNINTILAALTVQLQQLTQLVANPSLPAVPNTPPPPIPSPPMSPSPAPTVR